MKDDVYSKYRYGFLVGVGKRASDNDAMKITATDADQLKNVLLKRCHFLDTNTECLTEKSATRDKILMGLDALIEKTHRRVAELVIIYFSGHGCEKATQYFLVAHDTDDALEKAIGGREFIEKIKLLNTHKLLLLLDCCHSGGFANPINIPFDEPEFLEKNRNRVILTASDSNQVSFLSKPVSLFTFALIEGLSGRCMPERGNDVTLFDLAMYLRERVSPLSKHRQKTQFRALESYTTDFVITTYPEGKPKGLVFDKKFELLDAFNKKIDVEQEIERDEEFRNEFKWLAEKQDKDRHNVVKNFVNEIRKKYSLLKADLKITSSNLGNWKNSPPKVFNEEIGAAINLASEIATEFKKLSVEDLEYTIPYGSGIHPTVVWGQATQEAFHLASLFSKESRKIHDEFNEELKKEGIEIFDDMPNRYSYELLERVVNSLISLLDYDISELPQGFLDPSIQSTISDFRPHKELFVARIDFHPELYIFSVNKGFEILRSFVARNYPLYPICCRVNVEGTIDVVAKDSEFLYLGQKSSANPTHQFDLNGTVLSAKFISAQMDASLILVENGIVEVTHLGQKKSLSSFKEANSFKNASIWVDSENSKDWGVIGITRDDLIVSSFHGETISAEVGEEFWKDPMFLSDAEKKLNTYVHWEGSYILEVDKLDGLQCVILLRDAYGGSRISFLDPRTLMPLRRPIVIQEFIGDVCMASGHFLVTALLQRGDVKPRLKFWDLHEDSIKENSYLLASGDIYKPVVLSSDRDKAQILMVHRLLDLSVENQFKLVKFQWPTGEIIELDKFKNLIHIPVDYSY